MVLACMHICPSTGLKVMQDGGLTEARPTELNQPCQMKQRVAIPWAGLRVT